MTHVIQVGLPSDTEQYIHRIGRTGRADNDGCAIILLAPWEQSFIQKLEKMSIEISAYDTNDAHLKQLMTRRSNHIRTWDAAQVDHKENVAFSDTQMAPALKSALQRVSKDEDLTHTAQQAYSSWIGFYNTNVRRVPGPSCHEHASASLSLLLLLICLCVVMSLFHVRRACVVGLVSNSW